VKQRLVILGTHIFAEEVADLVTASGDFELAAFAENWDRERCRKPLLDRRVIWIDDLAPLASTHQAICAIGSTKRRQFIEPVHRLGFRFATLRHPSASMSASARIGAGDVVGAGSVIAAQTRLGEHVIVNRGSLIGHHTTIGDYVTLSPGANIAGCVNIDEGAYIAMGATVLDRISVGAHSVVGAGAVVTRDVPERVQVQGVPARIVKENVEGAEPADRRS
jgi:acetyltransferase EpsM